MLPDATYTFNEWLGDVIHNAIGLALLCILAIFALGILCGIVSGMWHGLSAAVRRRRYDREHDAG